MRKPSRTREFPLPIVVGLLIGAVLIGVALLGQSRRSLVDVFHEAPTPEIPGLIANLGDASKNVMATWLGDGDSVPAVTPQASGPRIAVHVDSMRRVGTVLEIRGTIFNQTGAPLPFAIDNFSFVDATGVRYGNGATAAPITIDASAPFAFNIPIPPSRVLTMTVTYEPDPPLVITLLQERSTP